jgi:hypothetical protein
MPETVTVQGDQVAITGANGSDMHVTLTAYPELGTVIDVIRLTLAGDLTAIRARFDVVFSGTRDAWRMILTPRDAIAGQLLTAVLVDGDATAIRAIDIRQTNGDRQTLSITPG